MSLKSRSGMRSANHGTMGLRSNFFNASRRNFNIQGSSPFMADISRTMASLRPFFGLKTGNWSSDHPSWYRLKSRLSIAIALLWNNPYGHSTNSPVGFDPNCWLSSEVLNPPTAPKRPHAITRHGDTRDDPYYWLMDRESAEVLSHLRSENDYLAQELAPLKALESELFTEIKNRIEETDISVPVRKGSWWYFERTSVGLNYPISCRVAAVGDDLTPPEIDALTTLAGEQVILDENAEAGDSDYFSVGVLSVSPDDDWVCVGTDFDGDELHHVTVRPLAGQSSVDDELDDVHYGFAWAMDSRHFFYTRVDDAMRPFQLWRHELGTDTATDVLIFQEDDAQFNLAVGRSRDDAVIYVHLGSSMTTEVHYLDAHDPTGDLTLLEVRRHGIEYGVEHFVDDQGVAWWLKVTNEGARDFRLLVREVDGGEWREVIPERPGSRLDGVDAFKSFLAISERHDGGAAVLLVSILSGANPFGDDLLERSHLVEGPASPSTVSLSANPNFETAQLRVSVTSLVTPRLVGDIV